VDLPITAVKIALGIHTRAAREKPYLWGTIGYIPQPTKVKSGGQRELVDSRHHDGTIPYFEMLDNEGRVLQEETKKRGKKAAKDVNTKKTDSLQMAQDLHAMLDHILAGLTKLQKEGLKWDLIYNGWTFNDVGFVFFVPFMRCNTDEADRLCGACTNQTWRAKQLCPCCCCPTDHFFASRQRSMCTLFSTVKFTTMSTRALLQQQIDFFLLNYFKIHHHHGDEHQQERRIAAAVAPRTPASGPASKRNTVNYRYDKFTPSQRINPK